MQQGAAPKQMNQESTTGSARTLEGDTEESLVENEPYLGPAWAVAMFILYLLKEAFPADTYSLLWWFQSYVILLVICITIFTLVKRHQFYKDNGDPSTKAEEH